MFLTYAGPSKVRDKGPEIRCEPTAMLVSGVGFPGVALPGKDQATRKRVVLS